MAMIQEIYKYKHRNLYCGILILAQSGLTSTNDFKISGEKVQVAIMVWYYPLRRRQPADLPSTCSISLANL